MALPEVRLHPRFGDYKDLEGALADLAAKLQIVVDDAGKNLLGDFGYVPQPSDIVVLRRFLIGSRGFI